MKLKHLIATLSLAGVMAIGVGAFVGTRSEAKAESVSAGSSKTLYINHFNPGSDKGGSWSNFKYYLWGTGGNNGWPGVAFTDSMKTSTPNEYDEYQYVLTIDTSKYQSLILTGNSDSSWGGAFAKTEDITLSSLGGNGLYCGAHKGWQSDANVFAVGTYTYSTKTVYMLDLKGDVYSTNHYCHTFANGKTGTTWPGVAMTKVAGSNNLYSVEINSVLGNVIFNNNGTKQTATISNVSDGNTYIVYPDNGYNTTILNAATYIDKYMKFETVWTDSDGTGLCKSSGWYSAAKTALNGTYASYKTEIIAHEPTAARLEKWARANGETFNPSTGVFGRVYVEPISTVTSTSATAIVVIVTLVSLSVIGAYVYVRTRRKEN